jgi:hypothetical protein
MLPRNPGQRHTSCLGSDGSDYPPIQLAESQDQPDLLQACIPELARFRELLAAIPLMPVRPEDLVTSSDADPLDDRMRHFIITYHLLPQDALILAQAERLDVLAVATLDRDWRRATPFDVYTCP